MRRAHVFERTAPRGKRSAFNEPTADPAETARLVVDAVAPLIAATEAAGHGELAYLLQLAHDEAVRRASDPAYPP